MSLEATDIERRLCANRDAFVLKEHVSFKSKAWKHFSLIFEQRSDDIGSGRVMIFVGCVVSDLEIWTRVQLCNILRQQCYIKVGRARDKMRQLQRSTCECRSLRTTRSQRIDVLGQCQPWWSSVSCGICFRTWCSLLVRVQTNQNITRVDVTVLYSGSPAYTVLQSHRSRVAFVLSVHLLSILFRNKWSAAKARH